VSKGLQLLKEEWDVLESLAEEESGAIEDAEMIARLESYGLVERIEGRAELTPDARLKLASHHLLNG
jgi:hypothetical protein